MISHITQLLLDNDIGFNVVDNTIQIDLEHQDKVEAILRNNSLTVESAPEEGYAPVSTVGGIKLHYCKNFDRYTNKDIKATAKVLNWGYNAIINTLEQYENIVSESLYDSKHVKAGRFHYIPYSLNWFLHHLQDAYDILSFLRPNTKYRFLDVGCGIGTKVKLATTLFDAYGIEVFEPYAEKAKQLLRKDITTNFGYHYGLPDKERIFVEDAFQFKGYADYDVIYFYRPMSVYDKQIQLEKIIYNQMKEEALVIPIWHQDKLPTFIQKTSYNQVYIKLTNRQKLQKIRRMKKQRPS